MKQLIVLDDATAASLRKVKRSNNIVKVGSFFAQDGAWNRKKVCVKIEDVPYSPDGAVVFHLQNVGEIFSGAPVRRWYFPPVRATEPVKIIGDIFGKALRDKSGRLYNYSYIHVESAVLPPEAEETFEPYKDKVYDDSFSTFEQDKDLSSSNTELSINLMHASDDYLELAKDLKDLKQEITKDLKMQGNYFDSNLANYVRAKNAFDESKKRLEKAFFAVVNQS